MTDYHDIKAISASLLKAIETQGPRTAFENYIWGKSDSSAAMLLGTRVHLAVLEPDVFDAEFWTFHGDRRTREYKMESARRGGTCLPPGEHSTIMGIKRSVYENEPARLMVESGAPEVERHAAITIPGIGRHTCKAKADLVGPDWVADLKTTRNPDPRRWSYEVRDRGYDMQAYWYMTLFGAETFYFIIAANSAPYHCWVQRVDKGSQTYESGKERCISALRTLQACFRDGDFRNDYEKEVQVAE